MEIEKVAAESPEKILKEYVDRGAGVPSVLRRVRSRSGLGLSGDAFKNGVKFLQALYKAYEAMDCSLAEINPLVVTTDGVVMALDAKMNFDDNALDRHPELAPLRDIDEEGSAGGRGLEGESELHQAGRQRRLYGQWCRTRHGNHGHHQACRR